MKLPIVPRLNLTDYTFEAATLRSGLILGFAYMCIQLLRDVFTQAPPINTIINSVLAVCLFFLYLMARKKQNPFAIAMIMHLLLLPGFVFFWINFGGLQGSVPYFMFIYIMFIILTLYGALRFLALALYGLMITYLLAFPKLFNVSTIDYTHTAEILGISFDFFVCAILLSIFIVRVKLRFDEYHKEVLHRNTELEKLKVVIVDQNSEIENQKKVVIDFNANLGLLISDRVKQIEEKNKMLSEYAFINAHLLRGPLSRVLGITSLMVMEGTQYDTQQIIRIEEAAKEMDIIVRKINEVLH